MRAESASGVRDRVFTHGTERLERSGPIGNSDARCGLTLPLRRLRADELPVATIDLAKTLIGAVLVRDCPDGRIAGRIVETEAYILDDPASHAYRGLRERNASMFLGPFHAYVYKIYGTSFCVNVTSETKGRGRCGLSTCTRTARRPRSHGASPRDDARSRSLPWPRPAMSGLGNRPRPRRCRLTRRGSSLVGSRPGDR